MKQQLINKISKDNKRNIISAYFGINKSELSKKSNETLSSKMNDIPYKQIVKLIKQTNHGY